ncbi:MAG TPA: ABC transporter permease subunit [Planctomycetota bacterium]|nr:ABC transporter permease subunit [Planctomycetota bacterium]
MSLLDPIALKELRGVTRRWQTYGLRVLYLSLMALVVYQATGAARSRTDVIQPSEFAEIGRTLFHGFLALQIAFVTLAAVWTASDLVLKEARTGTLGLLYLTPLSAADVALGKWKAAMTHAAALILCGAPVLGVCVYLGGVDPHVLAMSLTVTVAVAAVASAFSFHFSAAVRSQAAVMGLTLAAMIGYCVAPLWFAIFGAWQVFAFLHPAFALGCTMAGPSTGAAGEIGWATALPVSLAFGWLLVRTSAGRLGRRSLEVPRPDDPSLPAVPSWVDRLSRGGRSRRVPEGDPLLWKELATRAALRVDRDVQRVVAWIFVIFLGVAWLATQGKTVEMIYFAGAVYVLLAAVSGSAAFSYEKEGRRFDMLLCTPVTNAAIVRAKVLAGLVSPEAMQAGALLALVLLGWSLRTGAVFLAAATAVVVVTVVFAYLLGCTCSLFSPNARSAFLVTSGILLLLMIVMPAAFPAAADSLHPVAVLQSVRDEGRDGTAYLSAGTFLVAYSGASLALWGVMALGLGRVTGRES